MLAVQTDKNNLPLNVYSDYYKVKSYYYNLASSFDVGWIGIELPAMLFINIMFSTVILYNNNY